MITLLEVKNLRVFYRKVEALKGVYLEVESGEIVALIGSNGAGKSTTLRTISGIERPTAGEICFDNQRIEGMAAKDIVKLGIAHVPEGRKVFSTMTVLENLLLGAYRRKEGYEVTRDLDKMYEHFPILKERHGQLAGSLSGGEQQMLVIARALMSNPRLLLMDEPSHGLSPLLVKEVASITEDINREGVSIVLVEQNARMALGLADRGYVLELGNVFLHGDARELKNDHRVKKAYLGG